jgi:hypothetical protein
MRGVGKEAVIQSGIIEGYLQFERVIFVLKSISVSGSNFSRDIRNGC